MSPVFFIRLIGGAVNGVKCVHADAALEAGRCFLAAETLHFHLFDEILSALMDVCEAVDFFARDGGGCCHEILILRHLGQIICSFYRIE